MTPDFAFPILLADIGGTNCRVGLIERPGAAPALLGRLETQAHPAIDQAIADLALASGCARPRSAVIAAAGPVTGTRMEFTNATQILDAGALGARLGLASAAIVNDFVAQAAAILRLGEDDLHILRAGASASRGARLAIGPGTGFGVGFIVDGGAGLTVVASEGGHAGLGAETDDEMRIWPHLERVEGRVTIESAVSGQGLARIDQALAAAAGAPSPPRRPSEVVALALAGSDARAVAAAHLFIRLMARAAGDLALVAKATGGVFICGGVAPRLLPLIDPDRFAAIFDGRTPMGFMLEKIPLAVVTAAEPAFLGLAAIADPASPLAAPEMAVWRP